MITLDLLNETTTAFDAVVGRLVKHGLSDKTAAQLRKQFFRELYFDFLLRHAGDDASRDEVLMSLRDKWRPGDRENGEGGA